MAIELSQETTAKIDELLTRYPVKQGALLPILHEVQHELGALEPEAIEWVAGKTGISPATAYGVVSFYPMFRTTKVGKYHIKICATLSCALGGAEELIEALTAKLGVGVDEITEDGLFTVSRVECLAACGEAPAVEVNRKLYRNVTADKVDGFLAQIQNDL